MKRIIIAAVFGAALAGITSGAKALGGDGETYCEFNNCSFSSGNCDPILEFYNCMEVMGVPGCDDTRCGIE